MDNITKQLVLALVLFVCTAAVVCFHFFGQPYTVPYQEISLPENALFSDTAVIPTHSTGDNAKESRFTPVRIYGALYCTADSIKLLSVIKTMLMLIASGLFIKPERYDVEFILNSDGMK